MNEEIKYLELKTGYDDNGPAWIGKVEFSKSGKSIYFNGHALKGNGHGLCKDLESGETYWVSGIKKNGRHRHWAGSGKIMIDRKIVTDYLKLSGLESLDLKKYKLITIIETDKKKFIDIENRTLY